MKLWLNRTSAKIRFTDLLKLLVCAWLLTTNETSYAQNGFELELPLIINQAQTGDISSLISETLNDNGENITSVSIPIERFTELVNPFANAEQLTTWLESNENNTENNTRISLTTLKARGLDIIFDSSSLSIVATVPRLGVQGLSLGNRGTPNPDDYYQQSRLSSGLNFVARNNINHRESNGTDQGFGDTNVDIAGFTSIGGFNGVSLFYQGSYIENDEREFARQDVTLIYDNYKSGIRFELGDVRPDTSDLQTSPDLLGFNIERNYESLNPFRNINPNGRSTFTLDRSARVSFEVNGLIVETRTLDAGSHSIRDFPLAAGSNDVRVFIDDGTSRTEVANFSTYLDFALLDVGLSDFGISAGFQRLVGVGRDRRYDDEASVLAFYNRGITQKLTLGASLEAKNNHHLIASNIIYGSKYGLFAAQVAASEREGLDTGYSGILSYNLERDITQNWSLETDLQTSYQDDRFVGITDITPGAKTWSTNARVSLTSNSQSFSLNASLTSTNDVKTESLSTTLTKTIGGIGFSAAYQYTKTEGDSSDSTLTFRISKSFGGGRIRGQFRSSDNEFRTEWNGRPSRSAGSVETSGSLINNDLLRTAEANLSYTGPRFEASARHITSSARQVNVSDASSTDITLAGAIGYADGQVAFGRPFAEGFVIVNPHKNLRGKNIAISQGSIDGDIITHTKRLSTTLVPLESSYRPLKYSFAVDDLPLGYDLGSGDVRLFPKFLSGYRYTLGSDASNTVLGKALWPDKTPLELVSGRLIPDEKPDDQPFNEGLLVFTNKTGRFVAEKASFGRYKLVFTKDDIEYFSYITIEDSDEPGLTQVGTITLKEQGE